MPLSPKIEKQLQWKETNPFWAIEYVDNQSSSLSKDTVIDLNFLVKKVLHSLPREVETPSTEVF